MDGIEILKRQQVRKLGILGGTFNPIHKGHISLCHAAIREFRLDGVLILVSGRPPHKKHFAAPQDRFRMCELILQDEKKLYVTRMELERSGRTFTIDSLYALKKIFPETELFYIIGTDTLPELKSWNRWEEVILLTNFICFYRPGHWIEHPKDFVRKEMPSQHQSRFLFAEEQGKMISSTSLRKRIAQGLDTLDLLPKDVRAYIDQKELYVGEAMSMREVQLEVKKTLSADRYDHTMRVMKTAKELALRFNYDVQAALWAALLHDWAKELSYSDALQECDRLGVCLDVMTRRIPHLIHGPLGAAWANIKAGIEDRMIQDAIACHTLGRKHMTKLDKILFLADKIEPGRSNCEEIRKISERDLDAATIACMDESISYLLRKRKEIHPNIIEARNALISLQV